ncbi:hypothetical protein ACFX2A_024896 [Malus domestica]
MEINYALALLLVLILNLGSLLTSLANSYCPPPHVKPPHAKPPPHVPTKPPHVKPPIVKPPPYPKPPVAKPPPHPKPPVVKPPPVVVPSPPPTPTPTPIVPVKPPPPTETPCPPPPPKLVPPPPSPPKDTCPIDTLKLGACVDVLGGLIHIGIGSSAKDACCPVLQGLVDLDAAICLCTTIKAKLLNVNLIIPIALQVLIACGKTPPSGFQCPA